jgi:predicted Zn finger-like uncharacterized protein
MDITCPQCKTEYEFDDDKVTEAGITVKCTNCDYMFKVRRKAIVETEPVVLPQEHPAAAGETAGEEKRWMIRTHSGEVYNFRELTTLQQWIVERKVTRDDQISRSGETWKRLGDIAELASFFQVVDAALAAAGAAPASAPAPAPSARHHAAEDEPAFSTEAAQFKNVGPSAAWEEGGDRLTSSHVTNEMLEEAIPRRATGKMIGIIVLAVVVVGGGAAGFLMRDRLKALFSGGSERSGEAYQAGRKLFLMDDEDSLRKADMMFAQAPQDSALALAARAEVFTTWAQHLREESSILEHKARRLEATLQAAAKQDEGAKGNPKPEPVNAAEDPKLVRLEATKLRDEASRKLLQAEIHSSAALKTASDRGEVRRAMADYLRLQERRRDEVQQYLNEARKLNPDDPESLYVEGALEADAGNGARAEVLLKQALSKTKARYGQSLLRAAFLLAVLDMREGRTTEARAQAEAILRINPDHRWAKLLAEELAAPPAPVASANPSPDAGPQPPPDQPKPPSGAPPSGSPPAAGGSYESLLKQGTALSERGRTMQAIKMFERALKLQPNSAQALTGLGYCHLDQERFASAISHFMRALRVNQTHGDALIGMAEAYKVQGNARKALDYYRAYLTAHPASAKAVMARRNVADLERKVGGTPPSPPPQPPPTAPPAPPEPSPSIPEQPVPGVPTTP